MSDSQWVGIEHTPAGVALDELLPSGGLNTESVGLDRMHAVRASIVIDFAEFPRSGQRNEFLRSRAHRIVDCDVEIFNHKVDKHEEGQDERPPKQPCYP